MKKMYIHFITWGLYLVSLFIILNFVIDVKTALIRTSTLACIQIFIFYINLKWILPSFYEKKKFLITAILNSVIILFSFGFNLFTESFTPHNIHLNYDQPESQHIDFELLFISIMPIILTLFISFILYDFQKQKDQQRREFEILSAEKQFLIQQINPHFLFNTLNNIYYLTYNSSPKGSNAVMQLSKMLNYSLYGEKEGRVILKDEVEYINNFISLFKLKDSNISRINFDYTKADLSQKISPMLLIPFIENAFKHGNVESSDEGYIHIKIASLNADNIFFECKNSFTKSKSKDNVKGIGIKNVTRRLELLYANSYDLKIENINHEFKVSLKIKVNV